MSEYETAITPELLLSEAARFLKPQEHKTSEEVLNILLGDVKSINFQEIVHPEVKELKQKLMTEVDDEERKSIIAKIKQLKVVDRQTYVIIIEELLRLATVRKWGICKNAAFVYLFNGAFWTVIEDRVLQRFLGDCAEKMGMPKYDARQYVVKEHLLKQFFATGFQAMPEINGSILINLKNGTFEINGDGKGVLRKANKSDFLKYQLPFEYNPDADCPMFQNYLDICLPDRTAQDVLAEFVGYVFAPHLKLEKALFLYGSGANGKSVFFDIVTALLGVENVSNYPIDNLCDINGYHRAMIQNKLVNYSSEIGRRFEVDKFKQLCSGEPVQARLPYGEPFQIRNYARLVFNANQLPKDIEQSLAFFRRFLIIPFVVTIPPEKQDVELSRKIISKELSGVFNWVLRGLDRITKQKSFSKCGAVEKELERYRQESDSTAMFLDENNYQRSINDTKPLQELYSEYRTYCTDAGYIKCGRNTFSQRLKDKRFKVVKTREGARIVYIEQRIKDDEL